MNLLRKRFNANGESGNNFLRKLDLKKCPRFHKDVAISKYEGLMLRVISGDPSMIVAFLMVERGKNDSGYALQSTSVEIKKP